MRIVWEVDDGYCGKSRPLVTEIDPEDLEGYDTLEERKKIIEEIVHQDFLERVNWYINDWGGALEDIEKEEGNG